MKTFLLLVFCLLAIAHEGWSQDNIEDVWALAQNAFNITDKDISGYIDATEVEAFYAKIGLSGEMVKRFGAGYMMKYDTDGDGKITYEEFTADLPRAN